MEYPAKATDAICVVRHLLSCGVFGLCMRGRYGNVAPTGLCVAKISIASHQIRLAPHPLPRSPAQLRHDHAVLRVFPQGHSNMAGTQQLCLHRGYLCPLHARNAQTNGREFRGKGAGVAGSDGSSGMRIFLHNKRS